MEPYKAGTNGFLFHFDESNSPFEQATYIYVILAEEKIFICDTHVGPDSMDAVKEFLGPFFNGRDILVFNTHYDWDHVWGNCSFPEAVIIAHKKCRELLSCDIVWEEMLTNNRQYFHGEVERKLPNLTFEKELTFIDDGVTFFHSPGHSPDSSSCFHQKDGVLYVGDNVEYPIPYFSWHHLDEYERSLQTYKDMQPKILVTGHSGIVGMELLEENLKYVSQMAAGEEIDISDAEKAPIHAFNLKSLLCSQYEEKARKALGTKFELKAFLDVQRENFSEDDEKIKIAFEHFILS
ncbi:MBL fold metallo-hydrolase [Candidatus Riflebacteria bacterium]